MWGMVCSFKNEIQYEDMFAVFKHFQNHLIVVVKKFKFETDVSKVTTVWFSLSKRCYIYNCQNHNLILCSSSGPYRYILDTGISIAFQAFFCVNFTNH